MAHDTNVVNKEPEKNNLYRIMDMLEEIKSRTASTVKDQGTQISDVREALARLEERCKVLDEKLPKGEKVYRAETPEKDNALNAFGRCITEAWRKKNHGRVSQEFAEFSRASQASTAQQEGATDLGGVLVPTVTYNQVARIVGEASIIRRIATIIPMTAKTMTMPVRSSGPSVSWPGELTAPTHSSVLFDNPQLEAKTLMAVTEVSSELNEDSVVALEPFFAQLFAEAIAAEENQKAFYSTTVFTGVCNAASIASTLFGSGNTFASVKYQDLVKLQYSINSKVISKGTFIMHATAFLQIANLLDSQNRPLFQTQWVGLPGSTTHDQQIAQAAILLGRPVYLTDAMPSTSGTQNSQVFSAYGDFSKFAFGDMKAMTIDWSDQVFFENNSLALRVRERIGMKVLIPGAFGILKSNI